MFGGEVDAEELPTPLGDLTAHRGEIIVGVEAAGEQVRLAQSASGLLATSVLVCQHRELM
jgi:hypothetical protein